MQPLSDGKYDKIKLTYELAKMLHFIEKHAKADAKKEGDKEFYRTLEMVEKQLSSLIEHLHTMACEK
jgi:hypothetical protein